jgi:hypothetical protein
MMASTATARSLTAIRVAGAGVLAAAIAYPHAPVHPATCPLRAATGIPCPLCGMTRAVSASVHGNITDALSFHPAGILVALLAVAAIVRPAFVMKALRQPAWIASVLLGAMWLWNLGFNPTFHQWLLPS